jgi:hypothetical protein
MFNKHTHNKILPILYAIFNCGNGNQHKKLYIRLYPPISGPLWVTLSRNNDSVFVLKRRNTEKIKSGIYKWEIKEERVRETARDSDLSMG